MITSPGKERGKAFLDGLEQIKEINKEGQKFLKVLTEKWEGWKAANALYEFWFSHKSIENIEREWEVLGLSQKLEEEIGEYPFSQLLINQIGYHFGELILSEMNAAYIKEKGKRRKFFIRYQFGMLHEQILKQLKEKEGLKEDELLRNAAFLSVKEWASIAGFKLNEYEEGFCTSAVYICSLHSLEKIGEPRLHAEINLEKVKSEEELRKILKREFHR